MTEIIVVSLFCCIVAAVVWRAFRSWFDDEQGGEP